MPTPGPPPIPPPGPPPPPPLANAVEALTMRNIAIKIDNLECCIPSSLLGFLKIRRGVQQ